MAEEEYDFIFKVLLLGNSDVGKSSLILRYVDQVWSDTFVPTIGVDFVSNILNNWIEIKNIRSRWKKGKITNLGYGRTRKIQKYNR